MSAAEITDALGLHSLRQRSWVGFISRTSQASMANTTSSLSNLPVPHPAMVSTKAWTG